MGVVTRRLVREPSLLLRGKNASYLPRECGCRDSDQDKLQGCQEDEDTDLEEAEFLGNQDVDASRAVKGAEDAEEE